MSEDKKNNQPPPELPDKDVSPPDVELLLNSQKPKLEKRVIINDDDD